MGISASLAASIAASKANRNGVYLVPAGYELEIQKVLFDKKTKGDTFIVELLVLKSWATNDKYKPNAENSQASYVVTMNQLSSPGNVKAFLMAALGVPEEQVTAQAIEEATNEKTQPLRFFRIKDVAFEKPQRNDPSKMFTYHNWEHVEPSEEEFNQVMARRKAADDKAAADAAAGKPKA